MKPRNFPGRKLRRQIAARLRANDIPSERECSFMFQPTDTRIRMGAAKRKAWLP